MDFDEKHFNFLLNNIDSSSNKIKRKNNSKYRISKPNALLQGQL
jgi:hypothetical protein